MKQELIAIGAEAPDFELSDLSGKTWRLSEKRGGVVAMLFYPGDETLVCTKQLCSVRDNWTNYLASGAEIVGISPGDRDTQEKFSVHHSLPMPLLSDTERRVTNIFAKSSWLPIWTTRAIVVVDANGIVRYRNVMIRALRPSDDEVLTAIHLAKYDAIAGKRAFV